MTTTTGKAREYLRVSKDATGRARSVAEQHGDHERDATANGWTLGTAYDDTASASKYARHTRDGFGKLLEDLRGNRFRSDVLIVWESSRGSRKVGEWVELLELLERRRVRLWVHTHATLYDPTNPRHRRTLLEDAVDSEYETGKSSQRIRRAHAALAAAGKPNGSPPYGFRRTYDPGTREGRQEIEPTEATVVREMYTRIGAGESLRAVSADLAARGVRSRRGKPFSIQTMRVMLLRESYAGLRVHRPADGGPVATVKAAWPALVDRATFEQVRAILTAPERKTRRPGRANHLLSMIAACDVCSSVLIAVRHHERWIYRCRDKGHVTVPEPELDELAEDAMFGYLARDDVAAALAAAARNGPELDTARDELADVKTQLADLYEQVRALKLSAAALAAIEPGLLADRDRLDARVRELEAPPALAGLITPGKGARRRWKAMPMSARREVARILLAPDLLGQLRVGRCHARGARTAADERVTFTRAEA